jgi:hypothetical protein
MLRCRRKLLYLTHVLTFQAQQKQTRKPNQICGPKTTTWTSPAPSLPANYPGITQERILHNDKQLCEKQDLELSIVSYVNHSELIKATRGETRTF